MIKVRRARTAHGAPPRRRAPLSTTLVVLGAVLATGLAGRGVPEEPTAADAANVPQAAAIAPEPAAIASLNQLFGTIRAVDGAQLTVEARDHRMIKVDASAAIKSYRTIVFVTGRSVNVLGRYDEQGVLLAQSIQRAKTSHEGWPPDR